MTTSVPRRDLPRLHREERVFFDHVCREMTSTRAAGVDVHREGLVGIAGSDRDLDGPVTADHQSIAPVIRLPPGGGSACSLEMDLVMGGRTRDAGLGTDTRMDDGGVPDFGLDSIDGLAEQVEGGGDQILRLESGDQGSVGLGGSCRLESRRLANQHRECSKILIATD